MYPARPCSASLGTRAMFGALVVALAVPAASGAGWAVGGEERDQYGGFESISADATGRFRVERIDGVWWFVDPDGHGFFSSGVNHVDITGDFSFPLGRSAYLDAALRRHGSAAAWAKATERRLQSWGINTLGAFSRPTLFRDTMPYVVSLSFSEQAPPIPKRSPEEATVRDFLGPWFEVAAGAYAQEAGAGCAADPWCIGVFTDNEPTWGRSGRQPISFFHAYANTVAGASSKVGLQRFLERRYRNDVERFNAVWGTNLRDFDDFQDLPRLIPNPAVQTAEQLADDHAFRDHVAERYFRTTKAALRSVSEDLLNLGPRFDTLFTPASIYEIAGRFVDVISLNNYEWLPATLSSISASYSDENLLFNDNPWDDLDTVYRSAERPIMITEFSYRSTVPNGPQGTNPTTLPYLEDQAARGARYRSYMDELYARPFVVGAHWFQLMDQPATGRPDGQDSNFGLVDIDGDPWSELTRAVAAENRRLPRARQR